MNTAAETKTRIDEDPKWWKIPLMEFVDDFRRHKDPQDDRRTVSVERRR